MKLSLLFIICCNVILLSACDHFALPDMFPHALAQAGAPGPNPKDDHSQTISVDTANRMIRSYLESIDYQENTNAIRSWSFNADTLRNYLNSQAGSHVANIRFFLAHTMDYILSGHEGEPLPVNSNDLTLIIIGVDSSGHEVYRKANGVFDHCLPCPDACYGGSLLDK